MNLPKNENNEKPTDRAGYRSESTNGAMRVVRRFGCRIPLAVKGCRYNLRAGDVTQPCHFPSNGSCSVRFLTSGENRGELAMTQGDRGREWLTMSFEVSSPLIVGGSLYLLDAVSVLAFGMIFTAGVVALRVQYRISQRPFKVVVDPEGITRELFWTGRTEHLSFNEITLAKRFEYWGQMHAWYRIESATGMRWTFTPDRGTEEFEPCFAFVNQLFARSKESG